jgi:hypothetical protein
MPSRKTFGRRASAQSASPLRTSQTPAQPRAPQVVPVAASALPTVSALFAQKPPLPPAPVCTPGDNVDAELEEWKALRKAQRRSFREPWRTASIVATIGFGVSAWLLPDSVANLTEFVTFVLGAVSLYAGFRRPAVASENAVSVPPANNAA